MSDVALPIGTVVGSKYRIEKLLGSGGMGVVYEATHLELGKRFAVKMMTNAATSESKLRFRNEALAAAKVGHSGIVDVVDIGEDSDTRPYIVMELLQGRSLAEVLHEQGPLPVDFALQTARRILRALAAAHSEGIIHRDVKPANIFISERDGDTVVKLLDFGIAKLKEDASSVQTGSGVVLGTPLYMAPEQILANKEIDCRADLWSVGATLFEMLTGSPVHPAPNAAAVIVRTATVPAPRVRSFRKNIPRDVDEFVHRALLLDREKRFATADEMIQALDELGDARPPHSQTNVRSRSWVVPVMFMIGCAAAATARFAFVHANHPERSSNLGSATATGFRDTSPNASRLAQDMGPKAGVADSKPTADAVQSSGVTFPAPSKSAMACPRGEVVSNGHCCRTGLVWQDGKCDRPLAERPRF